jgi:hypothetical protein
MKTPRQQILDDVSMIAWLHYVTLEDIMGKNRRPDIVKARHAAYWFVWFFHGKSTSDVARIFGRTRVGISYAIGGHMRRIGLKHEWMTGYHAASRRRMKQYSSRVNSSSAELPQVRVAA